MMKKTTGPAILGWSLVLVFGVVLGAEATVLDFDTVGPHHTVIPDGYGGLDWDNFGVADRTNVAVIGSGYDHGTVSGDFTALNRYQDPAAITGDCFNFVGAYLTGAWNDGLSVHVQGYRSGILTYDRYVVVDSTAPPTFYTFNFFDIDTLRFNSFGGTPHGYPLGYGTHFAMDNFTFRPCNSVPEPASLVLLGLGLSGMVLRRFRKA